MILGGGGWERGRRRGVGLASSTPTTCRPPAAFAGRTCSTTTIAATPAISASAPTRSSPRGSRPATWSSPSAAASARPPARPSRSWACRGRARPSSTSTTTPRSWAASTRPISRSRPGLNAFAMAAARPCRRPQRRPWADGDRRGACRGAGLAGADRASRAACSSARSWPGCAPQLPADAILTNGAGNYAIWANRHFAYRGLGTQLAPTSGSMGYGLPAAVAAKLRHPDRPVVCFAGDGCFLMTGQELATAVQYELPIIVVVVDNGMYGTIRMHQERDHPGPRLRHGAEEPGLRGAGPRLWRVRRPGRDHRGIRPGLRRGGRLRPAGAPAPDPRPGGDHAPHEPQRDPRRGPSGGPLTVTSALAAGSAEPALD